jgi:hypothetical protein
LLNCMADGLLEIAVPYTFKALLVWELSQKISRIFGFSFLLVSKFTANRVFCKYCWEYFFRHLALFALNMQ